MRPPKLLNLPAHAIIVPLAACGLLASGMGESSSALFLALVTLTLIGTVLVAVYHAEIIAHRIGEPLGTLVLALAVTVIEVSLIISMMLSGGEEARSLARDTVFATVMIICNGVVGLCLLAGGIRHHIVRFRAEGSSAALSVLAALTTLTLILPEFTTSTPGPTYTPAQLGFASLMSLILYLVFVFVQTIRHKDQFLPNKPENTEPANEAEEHGSQPSLSTAWASFVLLMFALVGVVGLAKQLSPAIKSGVARNPLGPARRAAQSDTNQPQPCPRLGPRHHRPDHPGGRRRRHHHGHHPRSRPASQGNRTIGPDPDGQRNHRHRRPGHHHAGHGAPCAVCRLLVPCHLPLRPAR